MRAPSDEHRYFMCLGSIVQSCPFNLNFCFECHPELIETYYTRRSTRHRREGKFRCDFCFEQQLNPLKYIKKHHLVAVVGKKQVLDLEPSGLPKLRSRSYDQYIFSRFGRFYSHHLSTYCDDW